MRQKSSEEAYILFNKFTNMCVLILISEVATTILVFEGTQPWRLGNRDSENLLFKRKALVEEKYSPISILNQDDKYSIK